MIPLYLQLENRYRVLEEIRQSLWNLEGEVLTDQMIERLSIDFHHLDINTGATSDLVTPYFLPRTSFPSCREMSGDLKDELLAQGQDKDSDVEEEGSMNFLTIFFPACLELTYRYYACGLREDLDRRIRNSEYVDLYTCP